MKSDGRSGKRAVMGMMFVVLLLCAHGVEGSNLVHLTEGDAEEWLRQVTWTPSPPPPDVPRTGAAINMVVEFRTGNRLLNQWEPARMTAQLVDGELHLSVEHGGLDENGVGEATWKDKVTLLPDSTLSTKGTGKGRTLEISGLKREHVNYNQYWKIRATKLQRTTGEVGVSVEGFGHVAFGDYMSGVQALLQGLIIHTEGIKGQKARCFARDMRCYGPCNYDTKNYNESSTQICKFGDLSDKHAIDNAVAAEERLQWLVFDFEAHKERRIARWLEARNALVAVSEIDTRAAREARQKLADRMIQVAWENADVFVRALEQEGCPVKSKDKVEVLHYFRIALGGSQARASVNQMSQECVDAIAGRAAINAQNTFDEKTIVKALDPDATEEDEEAAERAVAGLEPSDPDASALVQLGETPERRRERLDAAHEKRLRDKEKEPRGAKLSQFLWAVTLFPVTIGFVIPYKITMVSTRKYRTALNLRGGVSARKLRIDDEREVLVLPFGDNGAQVWRDMFGGDVAKKWLDMVVGEKSDPEPDSEDEA